MCLNLYSIANYFTINTLRRGGEVIFSPSLELQILKDFCRKEGKYTSAEDKHHPEI